MKMKKAISLILSAAMVLGMASCSPAKQKAEDKAFKPALDTSTSCDIKIAGGYENFEAKMAGLGATVIRHSDDEELED